MNDSLERVNTGKRDSEQTAKQATQRGFTLPELLFVAWALICVSLAGAVVWAAIHFISKFW